MMRALVHKIILRHGERRHFCRRVVDFLKTEPRFFCGRSPTGMSALPRVGIFAVFFWQLIFAAATTNSAVLEFLDGSTLHGNLRSIDAERGLRWEYPAAKQPLEFKPDNLAWLRFPLAAQPVRNAETTCQFRFANGDEFFGKLLSLDENEMGLQTWFGGKFTTPRAAVRALRFFPKGSSAFYEGPGGLEGWQVGKNFPVSPWRFHDGALVAAAPGTIGRDLQLPDASRVEFDLEWNAPFSLIFSFYTGILDGLNFNTSCYMFYINPGSISLQRLEAGVSSMTMGRTETIPELLAKKKTRLEFRADKSEKTLELLVDGKFVNQWKDNVGWMGKGPGILFFLQTEGAEVKISNIVAAEWDGRQRVDNGTNAPDLQDQIQLINRDKVSGKIIAVRDGKVKIASAPTPLEIPLERVTQIFFRGATTNATAGEPWEIQASVAGGGTISFALQKMGDGKILGENKNFGKISLNSESIRQIQFNPVQPGAGRGVAKPGEEIFWELDGK